MPDLPDNGDWTTWIIGTLMTVLTAVVGTAVTLAKMIESKYQKDVAALHKDIAELRTETAACQEDRLSLSIRVASLEAITKQSQNDISDINKHHH